MASNITIDDLPALDAPADNDKIPVWDVTGGTTKSITVQDFLEANTAKIAGLNTEVLSIGAWDMDATSYKIVSHSINYAKIRNVSFVIIRDTDPEIRLFPNEIEIVLDASDIWLFRLDLGKYDNVNFNDGTKNRGWVTIQYVD